MPGQPEGERPAHVVLIGMMGAGKSTVAALLGERLGRPVLDTDVAIEERTRRSVRSIFEVDGEDAFRTLERAAVLDALAAATPSVISVGGGALADGGGRDLVAGATVVWLRARPETLATRLRGDEDRPLLDGDALERLRVLGDERRESYAAAADIVVDVDDLSPAAVAEHIVGAVAP